MREIHAAVRAEVHLDDRREALSPRHFVRVVLIGPHEHDGLVRLLEARERLELLVPRNSRNSSPTALRVAGGR